jgi:enterochelin esterase family protein
MTKFAILTLAVLTGLPAVAQPPQAPLQGRGPQPQAVVIDQSAPTEDFKPSALNQPGKQYPEVNSQRRVRTQLRAPNAQTVLIDMGGVRYPMTKGENSVWTGVTNAQDEGFHYYQLNVDGLSIPDPGTQIYYGSSRWGSAVEVPAHDEDFYALKNVPHGQLREVHYFSKVANATLQSFVYTPPDYEKGSKRYPALYLQHGAGEDEHGWGGQGFTGRIMDNLIAEGKAKPFIGGAAPGRGPGPARGTPAAGTPAGPGRPGGGRGPMAMSNTPFEHALIEDIIPFIDANFRTLADQPHRGLAGLSMGGMLTHGISLSHLDKFSQIGMFSGGTIATSEIKDMADFKKKVKLLFVSYGSREPGSSGGQTSVEALKKEGVNAVFYESPMTAHEWQSWRRSLHEFAQLAFQK